MLYKLVPHCDTHSNNKKPTSFKLNFSYAKSVFDKTDFSNLSTAEFTLHTQLHLTMISLLLASQFLTLFHSPNFHHCKYVSQFQTTNMCFRRTIEGDFTRQERTTLAQIRTGHCTLLKAYRKRIGLEDEGTCETCKREEEDREHLMGRCPMWSQEWRETFGKPFLSHRELIKVEPAEIIAFLRRIGRLPANDSA